VTDSKFFDKASQVSAAPGASGYFSAPSETLDPNLFDGEHLKPEVRSHVMVTLGEYLRKHYQVDLSWLHIWIAGSGVSYQWAASRGNGDLDVLYSIDITPFESANPELQGVGESELAATLNDLIKSELWPDEREHRFGNQVYEITYFFNQGTGTDISRIHPYAAIDVLTNTWAVRPPQLPDDPRSLYPASWSVAAGQDKEAADSLSASYNAMLNQLSSSRPGSVEHHSAGARLNLVVQQATSLFNDIHGGRRDAFGPQGHGYGDYVNYRWQSAKESGAVQTLHAIASVGEEARKAEETELYGAPIDSAEVVLRRAANQYKDRT
jgi:hypothetical protein